MKPNQIPSSHSVSRQFCPGSKQPQRGRMWPGLVALICLLILGVTPRAAAQAYSATNYWTGLGAEPYWPVAENWTNNIAPTATSLIVLTNYGSTGLPGTNGSGAVGTANIVVTNDTTAAALWIGNTNLTGAGAGFHTVAINSGATLTISNIANTAGGVTNILQVCSQSGASGNWGVDNGVNTPLYATIQGAGATLRVISTNGLGLYQRGNIFVAQGSLGLSAAPTVDPCNSTLDLSGLDNFTADINRLCVGADSGRAPFFFNRPAGTIYLAKTNILTLWAVSSHPSASLANQGILAGMIAQNNGGGYTRSGRIFLGQTNAIFCNTGVGLGIRGCSGWMGFNPSNAPGTSVAYFRDRAGTGRQTRWAVGNRLNASVVANLSGEMDFSLGTVDALVDLLGIGVSATATTAATTIGALSFGAGTIDVNSLQVGVQAASGAGIAQGTLNVSNTAVLQINTSGDLAGTVGSLQAGDYFGRLNITDGGTVAFGSTAPLTCGVGSTSEIKVLNGSSLKVLSIGTAAAPLTSLQLSGSTLTVDRGTASNPTTGGLIFVNNLDLSGVNTINMLGPVLVVGQFPIIKYGAIVNGSFANLTLGSTSPGVTGYLSNNVANSSIDFVVTSSATAVLTWDGRTNGVNVDLWDIGLTPDWQGAKVYSQASVPGSLVQFDDTAAGTTTVNLTTASLSPASLIVTNNIKNYSFVGAGSVAGPTALTKNGTGTLTLANTGTNTFSGGVFLNDGTLRNGGNGNTLPPAATVTIQDLATAALDLNNTNLGVGVLTGGGASGGNITLGSGNLTISAGGGNYAGVISGTGVLIKNGSGTQTLSGNSTFSGGSFVTNSSVLVLNSGLGTGPLLISTNGLVQLGDGATDGAVFGQYITNYGGTLHLKPANDMTFTNLLVGTGGLIKTIGSETTVYITNANAFTGSSAVQQGTLQISHPNALGTGSITIGNALPTTRLNLVGGLTVTNAITLSGKTGAFRPAGVSLNNFSETNLVTGPMTVTGSTLWSIGAEGGKLIVSGNFINTQSGTLCEFFLRGGSEGLLASGLKDNGGNRLMLTKVDSGTWTLAGTNTYTGRTQVDEGLLVVDGSVAGDVVVARDPFVAGNLAGKGSIGGVITNQGSIFPGGEGTIGTLTAKSSLYLEAASTVTVDVSTNGNDQIRGLTNAVYDGTLNVMLSGPLSGNCIFKLFDATTYSGNFASINLPDIFPLTWDTTQLAVDGTLRAVGAPIIPPAITSITAGAGGSFSISGTGTVVAPFNILASTNVALPLSGWVNLGGGTFNSGSFLFTDLNASNYPVRFYRLITPSP